MTTTTKTSTGRAVAAVVLIWLAAISVGCAPRMAGQPVAPDSGASKIVGIKVESDADTDRVRILGNRPLTFTTASQSSPRGVVLHFPQTELALADAYMDLAALETSGVVAGVRPSLLDTDQTTALIEIEMKAEAPYDAVQEGDEVVVAFVRPLYVEEPAPDAPGPAPHAAAAVEEAAAPEPSDTLNAPPATRLEAITVQRLENGVEVRVRADGPIKDFTSFTLSGPDRMVYDIFGVTSPYVGEQTIDAQMPWVSRVRYYGDKGKLRVVLDTKADRFQATTAKPIQDGLLIHVGDVARKDAAASAAPSGDAGSTVWINRVDFSAEPSGKSVVIVGTSRPVSYRLDKLGDRRLQLRLDGARLPDYRRRPLDTTRFASAVDRVLPEDGGVGKDESTVVIELRQTVPYTVEQVDDLILVHFDKLPAVEQRAADTVFASLPPQSGEKPVREVPEPGLAGENETAVEEESRFAKRKSFTGEKIALDFYETDIKNVFRILKEVSGKNFAIDPDVQGTVTLTFDKPVPWDQVMDLVLRMNQLGQVMEGDVIRIATLQTLQREEKLRQDSIEAERKTKEAEKSLDPLVSEFIAINYANVTDVKDKIGDLVSKDRGSIVVDQKNSQILINDTKTQIGKIKERIKRLDKITPQVLIEARIVEATKNFSRSIGTRFGIGPGEDGAYSDSLGGLWNLNLSSNFPQGSTVGSGSGVSFTFDRLVGSPLSINAAIDASETEGETKIISSPRILTLNAEEAEIKQGLTTYQNRLDESGNTVPEEVEINLELAVTPEIKSDNRIDMKIEVKKEDFAGLVAGNISKTTNFASTRLLVNDGETIVIGGITKTQNTESLEGLPGLRKVPILGLLFGAKTDSTEKQELLIFITTRIAKTAS
jgi:type IV pilus assembly protein PilQ